MKRLSTMLLALALLLLGASLAAAQSAGAAGDWDVVLDTPGGARNFKASFKLDGEKLSGVLKGERGELPIQGAVNGKEIKFSYTVKYMENDLTITMTGDVDGDAIKGVADFGGLAQGEWSAKRAGAAAATGQSAASEKIDVTGTWLFEVETGQGSGSPTFVFKQEGEKLTGQYKGLLGEAQVAGTVKGNQIEFSFKVSGGQLEGTITYTGAIEKDAMSGKVKFAELGEGTWKAKKQ